MNQARSFDVASRISTLSAAGALSGTVSLDGSATLRDLSTQLRWTFPREAGVETLAGFLLLRLGHIPAVGESLDFDGRRYTIAEMAGRRIARVNIEPLAASSTAQPTVDADAVAADLAEAKSDAGREARA